MAPTKTYPCKEAGCGDEFTDLCSLNKHTLKHEKPQPPPVCKGDGQKKKQEQVALNRKIISKSHICDAIIRGNPCNKAFLSQNGLDAHKRIHQKAGIYCIPS